MRFRKSSAIAAAWGFAEATFFFIVPDVLLSWYAIQSCKKGMLGCVFAVLGALLGGALVWWWGQGDVGAARDFLDQIPAIDDALLAKVQSQIEESGLLALFIGPFQGTPYKIYVLEAASMGYGLAILMLVSIPSRFVRFLLVALVVGFIGQLFQKRYTLRTIRIAHLSCWAVFYAWYFWVMGS